MRRNLFEPVMRSLTGFDGTQRSITPSTLSCTPTVSRSATDKLHLPELPKQGMQDCSFDAFVPPPEGEIPWHRVYAFDRLTEFGTRERIWDRDLRMDSVFGSGRGPVDQSLVNFASRQNGGSSEGLRLFLCHSASHIPSGHSIAAAAPPSPRERPSASTTSTGAKDGLRDMPGWRWNAPIGRWQEVWAGGSGRPVAASFAGLSNALRNPSSRLVCSVRGGLNFAESDVIPLTVVTWNVLFDAYEAPLIYTDFRIGRLDVGRKVSTRGSGSAGCSAVLLPTTSLPDVSLQDEHGSLGIL